MNSKSAKIVERGVLIPFILITSLFFLWGIANDMTNPMVSAFKKVMNELSNFESALIQAAFYGGYAVMAIPAALFIRKFSYKSGILIGLALYAIGTLLFYPAAQFEVFAFFLMSFSIMTFGLAFLETTANPFVLSLGSKETSTQRLNLAQSFNPIGSLTGMGVAQFIVIIALMSPIEFETQSEINDVSASGLYTEGVIDNFKREVIHKKGDVIEVGDLIFPLLPAEEQAEIRTKDLRIISNPYVVLGILLTVFFILFAIVKMPKRQDESSIPIGETFKVLLRNKRYREGVLTQLFYVGAQIMCWTFIFQYVDNLNETRPADKEITATYYNMVAMGLFMLGRWICTYLIRTMNPGKLMFRFALIGIAFTLGTIFIVGYGGLLCLIGISIGMSLMFPTIYGIALKDMGDEAKLGSAGLVVAIGGGAIIPPLAGKILDIGGDGFADKLFFGYIPEVNLSFILVTVCLSVVALYSYRSYKYHLTIKT